MAALTVESTLSFMLLGDRDSAMRSLERYKAIEGPKDSEDVAAMNIVAGVLGVELPDTPIPTHIEVDFEQRLKAALQILQGVGRQGGA
jgi:hypothetical protein